MVLTLQSYYDQVKKAAHCCVTVSTVFVFLGIMFYAIGRELFSGQSPSGVYSRAFKLCKKHEKVYISITHTIHVLNF